MVSSLTYRTADITRWGGGQGSDLSAVAIDLNFWTLFSAVQALQDHENVNAGIDYISQPVNGNLFYIHLTNHAVLGPFTIPSAQWNPRGEWAATTAYAPYDVVSNNGNLYLVMVTHVSGATFSPSATDGNGNPLYVIILSAPANSLPAGGVAGQKLISLGTGYASEWQNDKLRMTLFVEGQPQAGELLLMYGVVDNMTLPANLPGSKFYNITTATANAVYTINKNGASVGYITFNGSAIDVTFPTDVTFVYSDLITIVAPATPDATHANISFTFVALLTP